MTLLPAILGIFCVQARPADVQEEPAPIWTVSAFFRMTAPNGDAAEGDITYGDLFKGGVGASLEGSLTLPSESMVSLSGYLALGFDEFRGERYDDDSGDSLKPEPLLVWSGLGGAMVRFSFDDLMSEDHQIVADFRLGGGVVCYTSTDADFTIGGVPHHDRELFESTVAGAWELGMRTGVVSRSFGFLIGLSYRGAGGPRRGRDVTSAVDPGTFHEVSFEIGWDYRL